MVWQLRNELDIIFNSSNLFAFKKLPEEDPVVAPQYNYDPQTAQYYPMQNGAQPVETPVINEAVAPVEAPVESAPAPAEEVEVNSFSEEAEEAAPAEMPEEPEEIIE